MEYVILWLGMAVAAGVIASSKGRSGFGFFILGVFFPLIGLIIAAFIAPRQQTPAPGAPVPVAPARVATPPAPPEPQKRCPSCAEMINAAAMKCRYCGEDVSQAPGSIQASESPVSRLRAAGYRVVEDGNIWRLDPPNNAPHIFVYDPAELKRWADRVTGS